MDNIERPKPSDLPLLYQQFQEQSPQCDVTVKVGSWEKRFHWRVLMASPFFEAAHRNNFMEKQTGIIELNKWPASLVEQSLLLLYGRRPNVTELNRDVDKLLDIAEFLLIPELTTVCVDFLENTEVTVENCMHLFELSSAYGFHLEDCERFMFGHLPEVLEQEGMLTATTETVKMLLGGPTLSYVPVQSWFNFLIRWVHTAPERLQHFSDLFHMLDFIECDRDFINNIVAKEPLVVKNTSDLENLLATSEHDHNDTVVIFKNDSYSSLICLNLRTTTWRRVDITTDSGNEDLSQFKNRRIFGVKDSLSSHVYKFNPELNDGSFSVHTHDIATAESCVTNVIITDSYDAKYLRFDAYSLANDMLVAVGHTFEKVVLGKLNVAFTLYIGKLTGPDSEMNPFLTIKDHIIVNVCLGDNGTIAMLSMDRDSFFILDYNTGELECVRLERVFPIRVHPMIVRLAGCKDGFVLYDNYSVVCVSRLSGAALDSKYVVNGAVSGAALDSKYVVSLITWERPPLSTFNTALYGRTPVSKYTALYETNYYAAGDRWFRHTQPIHVGVNYDTVTLDYVSHEDLMTTEDTARLPWTEIPVPPEAGVAIAYCTNVFAVSLPKGTARCHLECPHCRLIKGGKT